MIRIKILHRIVGETLRGLPSSLNSGAHIGTPLRQKQLFLLMLIVLALIFSFASLHAQDAVEPTVTPIAAPTVDESTVQTSVYVTTQDLTSFRLGPGVNWERTRVLDPGVTMPAIGRTANTTWVQVVYNGEVGWVYYALLVWTGDIVSLPVDGVDPLPYVRRTDVVAVTIRETPIYAREVTPSDQVGTLPPGTIVEVVGRLGERGYFQLQILYEGQLYWIGSWNVDVFEGSTYSVLDTRYLYSYGRLISTFNSDIRAGANTLGRIESIWRDLEDGNAVSCDRVPGLIGTLRTSDTDISSEPEFRPAATAMETAIGSTNTAIAMFDDACNRDDVFITQRDVRIALDEIDNARRYFNIARSLIVSLGYRDPLVGDRD